MIGGSATCRFHPKSWKTDLTIDTIFTMEDSLQIILDARAASFLHVYSTPTVSFTLKNAETNRLREQVY